MSGNDFFGALYEKPQKPYGFSWLEGVQTSQESEIPLAPATTPSPVAAHFVRFIAPRVLLSPSITLVSVLSGIRQNPSVQALFGEQVLC